MLLAVVAHWGDAGVAVLARAYGFSGRNHPVVGYIGYTKNHLPDFNRPLFESSEDASVASFAARMAFSSFAMRARSR